MSHREALNWSALTVVFCPPVEMTSPDHKIEYETNERPGNIVNSSSWRYRRCAGQHHRDADDRTMSDTIREVDNQTLT